MKVYRMWQRLSNRSKWELAGSGYDSHGGMTRLLFLRANLVKSCRKDPDYVKRHPTFQLCFTTEEVDSGAYPESRYDRDMRHKTELINLADCTVAHEHVYVMQYDTLLLDYGATASGFDTGWKVTASHDREKNSITKFDWWDVRGGWRDPGDYFEQEIIDEAQRILTEHFTMRVFGWVVKGRQTRPYAEMLKVSAEMHWPTCYEEDLTWHDARFIGEHCPLQFVWILRKCGTHLLVDKKDVGILEFHIKNGGEGTNYKCFFWNGSTLKPVTAEEARKWLLAQ